MDFFVNCLIFQDVIVNVKFPIFSFSNNTIAWKLSEHYSPIKWACSFECRSFVNFYYLKCASLRFVSVAAKWQILPLGKNVRRQMAGLEKMLRKLRDKNPVFLIAY